MALGRTHGEFAVTAADVNLWGRRIGAISVDRAGATPRFQYTPEFASSGFEVAPVKMPLSARIYDFPTLVRSEAFGGLPGLLADSLPDRWGRTLVDGWLESQGRSAADFDVVERLCYVGARGMGALEFEPAVASASPPEGELHVEALVKLASEALADKSSFVAELGANPETAAVAAIMSLGTSAGGARPKALIAYNDVTGEVRSGQIPVGPDFGQWLIKFDGVAKSGDHGLNDPQGWGVVEYAYSVMATAAGIEMSECRLLEERGRRHFMTRRFDRAGTGKLHLQTVAALEHVDYNVPGIYSYEQALRLMRLLGLDARATEQFYRRMVFNVVARNQDDHVKNIAFLLDRDGQWRLSPAYDLTWSYKPGNQWLESHQMTINGKRDDFVADDLFAVARAAGLKRGRDRKILDEVTEVVREWPRFADEAGVDERLRDAAAASHRLSLVR